MSADNNQNVVNNSSQRAPRKKRNPFITRLIIAIVIFAAGFFAGMRANQEVASTRVAAEVRTKVNNATSNLIQRIKVLEDAEAARVKAAEEAQKKAEEAKKKSWW